MADFRERAVVFVDGNNLYKGLKVCYGIERLDLEPFCRFLAQDRELRAIYYADANFLQDRGRENYRRQQAYFSHIRKIKGLVFRKGYYNKWTSPPTEKACDVYLATDMVDLFHRDEFDIAYLASGDADLAPAVDIVVSHGSRSSMSTWSIPRGTPTPSGRTAWDTSGRLPALWRSGFSGYRRSSRNKNASTLRRRRPWVEMTQSGLKLYNSIYPTGGSETSFFAYPSAGPGEHVWGRSSCLKPPEAIRLPSARPADPDLQAKGSLYCPKRAAIPCVHRFWPPG